MLDTSADLMEDALIVEPLRLDGDEGRPEAAGARVEHHLRLSPEEVLALRKTVNMVNRGAALFGDTDPRFLALLDVLEEKLDVDLALCRHCHGAPRRSRDGLCALCAQYRRDDAKRREVPTLDGLLPPASVLRRRVQRAAQRKPGLRLVG